MFPKVSAHVLFVALALDSCIFTCISCKIGKNFWSIRQYSAVIVVRSMSVQLTQTADLYRFASLAVSGLFLV